MKEVTRIINVEITCIDEISNEEDLKTKEEMESYIKEKLNADKVEVKGFKDFIMDKKKGKK